MKLIYSEIFKKASLNLQVFDELKKILPNKFYLAYTIQYKPLALKLKQELESQVIGFSQVLGCSKLDKPYNRTVLLISEARFHAINLLKYSDKVIIFDGKSIAVLGNSEKERIEKENQIKFANLLNSDKIGILVSTKPGQYNINDALKVKAKLIKMNKHPQIFFFDMLRIEDLENFQMQFWINTSCPGIECDSNKIMDKQTFLIKIKNSLCFTTP